MGKIILNGKEYVTSTTRGFPPLIYSDDEREVGVWRDGKPLYQKCINLSSSTSVNANTWTTIYTDTLIGSIEQLIYCLYINFSNGGVYNAFYYKPNDNNLQVYTSSGFDFVSNNKLIIQYTKTTDTSGSGKYSPVSDLSHHYSTTEQVVGTWIDGNTIYETSYELTSAKTLSGSWSHSNIVIDNISKVIRVVAALDADGQTIPLVIGLYSGYELALAYSGGPNNSLKYFTIQYTKSSS